MRTTMVEVSATPAGAGRVVLGGYAAKQCPRYIHNTFSDDYANAPLAPVSDALRGRLADGNAFEAAIGDVLPEILGDRVMLIPDREDTWESKRLREQLTVETMEHPGRVVLIWNARLPVDLEGHRIAEPDYLVRLGRRSDGRWAWAPGDVKHHSTLEGAANPRAWMATSLVDPVYARAFHLDLGAGLPHKSDAVQLAHYRRVLEYLGYAQEDGEPNLGVVIGKEGWLVWFDLDAKYYDRGKKSAQEIYDTEFAHRVAIAERALAMNRDPALEPLALPEWKPECKECPFHTVCRDELIFEHHRHITLLPGITPTMAQPFYRHGHRSAKDLAFLSYATAVGVDAGVDFAELVAVAANRSSDSSLELLTDDVAQVTALAGAGFSVVGDLERVHWPTAAYAGSGVRHLARAIDQARVTLVERVHRARGVEVVQIPQANIESDIDIEDAFGRCYLIGVLDTGKKEQREQGRTKMRREYHPFVDWTPGAIEEARVFTAWWQHTQSMQLRAREAHWSYRCFYYTEHETRYFRHLVTKYAGRRNIPTPEELEAFFASNVWVDLRPIVAGQLIWPTEDMTLKSLAKYVKFSWRDDAPGGGNSISWYQLATESADEAVRLENRKRLLAYNEDDVLATYRLRDWIASLGEARKPGTKLPSVEDLDRRFEWRHR